MLCWLRWLSWPNLWAVYGLGISAKTPLRSQDIALAAIFAEGILVSRGRFNDVFFGGIFVLCPI